MYPSVAMAMNISKATKYSTTIHVDGCPYTLEQLHEAHQKAHDATDSKEKSKLSNEYKAMALANTEWLDEFFGKLATTEENAVDLCHQVFELPNFEEMSELFKEYYKN